MSASSFRILTLGCKINQYESQRLRETLLAQGLVEAGPGEPAALVVVNSCAVTQAAVADARALARKAAAEAPKARIVLTGCAASAAAAELAVSPSPAEVVPGRADALPALLGLRPDASRRLGQTGSGATRARAVLKVQDGCRAACAFCIVPKARGGPRSKPVAEAVAEAADLARAGYAEIVVSGVNLGQYQDDDGADFWDLLGALDAALAPGLEGRLALRLSSLDPGLLGPKGLDALSRTRLVAPHLHLSLQSGHQGTLTRMRRPGYTPDGVVRWLEGLSNIWPRYALGADLLAGFPGETDTEFQATLAMIDDLRLTYAHVFPYSPRPGTTAATMPGRVPKDVARARARTLRARATARKLAFARDVAALPALSVVVERGHPLRGMCQYYLECEITPRPGAPLPEPGSRLAVVPTGTKGETVLTKVAP